MLILYFSGTGNTQYVAETFCEKMNAFSSPDSSVLNDVISIEAKIDFAQHMNKHDCVALCYPIYGSRVPYMMRVFVHKYRDVFKHKKLVVLITQAVFSGDGARVLCDLIPGSESNVLYAEHIAMPSNICNFIYPRMFNTKKVRAALAKADKKLDRICFDINKNKIVRRGFNPLSKLLGLIQGSAWQGKSRCVTPLKNSMEHRCMSDVRIGKDCNACGICVRACPMKNLVDSNKIITQKHQCTACYRCVNVCPKKAITVFIHKKPKWQYRLDLIKNMERNI